MKIYAKLRQENEEDQCVIFDLKPARLGVLRNLCEKHKLAEACVKLEDHSVVGFNTLPVGGPLDGFMSQEDQDELADALAYGDEPTEPLDMTDVVLEMLHVSKDRIHVEILFSDESWWSTTIMIEEVEAWTSR